MKNKRFLITLLITFGITLFLIVGIVGLLSFVPSSIQAESISVTSVSQGISASGTVGSENEATLHFPIAGKVVYLPFKEGDTVTAGQTIASLDERTIEDNLQSAVAAAQNQQISFDNINDFNGNRDLSDTGLSTSARRQLQTAINTLDQAKIAVEIQKIAQEQAFLISPINGIITEEDITTPNVNVTTLTSFSIADPTTKIFKAQVRASDIDFVSVGAEATVRLDGQDQTFSGTVEKVYPQKTTLPTGEDVYKVDIQAPTLAKSSLFGQAGSVTIQSNDQTQSIMVPTWAILGHNNVWVLENNKAILKTITVGRPHGNMTEVTSGLSSEDKVIINPEKVAKEQYSIL